MYTYHMTYVSITVDNEYEIWYYIIFILHVLVWLQYLMSYAYFMSRYSICTNINSNLHVYNKIIIYI